MMQDSAAHDDVERVVRESKVLGVHDVDARPVPEAGLLERVTCRAGRLIRDIERRYACPVPGELDRHTAQSAAVIERRIPEAICCEPLRDVVVTLADDGVPLLIRIPALESVMAEVQPVTFPLVV